jgi:DNA-binding SARP family transcriptional activator
MHFQILGPLRVTDGDEREIALGGAKPAALLAMLVARANEVVPSDQLIEELWDGRPPPTANKTLQVHISRLRRALAPAGNGSGSPVVTRSGGYVLEVDPDRIDALRFERLVAEGNAALGEGAHARASSRLRAALALWRGEPFTDFAYASFAQDPIARLEGMRTVALEAAIEAELALGRHAELIPELKSLLKRHPLSERLRAQLMLALYRSGRQAEALGVYRAGRRILVDRLGIEPSAELRELERAILAHDAEIAAPAPRRRSPETQPPRQAGGLLVGYDEELAALQEALEQMLTGRGAVALVSGEPGVGKTRLADELASVARARGAQVAWGRSWEGGGAPPFWAWIQLLRALVADRDAVSLRTELGPAAGDLAQLLPELRDLRAGSEAADVSDPEEGRFQLYNAVAGFLDRVAARQPLVVVLDDLHAADPSTLGLLGFMAGAVQRARILLVGTYRDTQVTAAEPLSETLTDLTRVTDCLQLVLTGLSSDDTAHFVELSAGVAPMAGLAGSIHEASNGNPLFVSELVRLLRAEDRLEELGADERLVLPRGVDQVISRRLQHLPDPCRRVLSLAAVIGREFDLSLLERAGEASGDALLELLAPALAARVVEESHGARGDFRFSHELVRQALYEGIPAGDRRRAHAAIAAALEAMRGSAAVTAAELAHHWTEAVPVADTSKAIDYLTLAGDEAAELTACDEAAAYYDRAAEIARASGADPALLRELCVKLAEQLMVIPELERAQAVVADAEALAHAGFAAHEGRLGIVRAHLDIHDACTADRQTLTDLIETFSKQDDPANEARAWEALFTWYRGRNRNDPALKAAEQALVCARRAGSASLTASALRGVASGLVHGPTPVGEAIPRLRALLAEAVDGATRARIQSGLAELEAARGRFSEARRLLDEAQRSLEGQDIFAFVCTVAQSTLNIERLAGNLHAAEQVAREVCATTQAMGLLTFLATDLPHLADVLIEQGRLDEAAAELAHAQSIVRPDDDDALFRQARARGMLELARGDLAAAEASIRGALVHATEIDDPIDRVETFSALARVLFAAGRGGEAREMATEALAISETCGLEVHAQRMRDVLGSAEPAHVG